jgi:hypothetical protein
MEQAPTHHSRGALQAMHRKLIARYCFEGDVVDIDRHLRQQAQLCHEQTVKVRAVQQMVDKAEQILRGVAVVDVNGNVVATPDIASIDQPYVARMEKLHDDFEVFFQRKKIGRLAVPAAPGPVQWRRDDEKNGAVFELGSRTTSSDERRERWAPCFAALEKLENTVAFLDGESWVESDSASPQAITPADKEDALREGFQAEAEELSAFVTRWLEVLHARLSIASIHIAVGKQERHQAMPSRAIQCGESQLQPLTESYADQTEVTEVKEQHEAASPFAASQGHALVERTPFAWIQRCSNRGYTRIVERFAAAIRIQAWLRGSLTRRTVGDFSKGTRTLFHARDCRVAVFWVTASRGGAMSEARLLHTCAQLLVGFTAARLSLEYMDTFAAFALDHFTCAFASMDHANDARQSFLASLNTLHRCDPLVQLVFLLVIGDFSAPQEKSCVELLVALIRTRQPHASATVLPLDVSHPDDALTPAALRSFLRACNSLTEHSLGVCHRRFWWVSDLMIPTWVPSTDVVTVRSVERQLLRTFATAAAEESAAERRVGMRQALLFACLAFCM